MLLVALCISLVLTPSFGAFCSGKPQPGERTNLQEIVDVAPKLVKRGPNAKLFTAGPANAPFNILHLWGTPYEVGYAQGLLQRATLIKFVEVVWTYLENALVDEFPSDTFSPAVKKLIADKGMIGALDWTTKETEPFTPIAYNDEVRGMADASGISYEKLWQVNMFPELTKASCSFFGAWGTAVKKAGHSYQLRALDYGVDGPFRDFPQVTVYHPSVGNAWAQVGFPGSVGVLTGFSSQKLAISEIGVSYADDSFGQGTDNTPPEKVKGEPWMFVLRDVLQFEDSMVAGNARIAAADRTCSLIIGLGDGKANRANGIQYSGYVAVPYDDTNQLPVNETWHPVVKDTVYNGMDWLCPGYTEPLGQQLQQYHGLIDETVIIQNILPTVQTGDLHIAVYDLTNANMHVSFCKSNTAPESEPLKAFERQFTRLRMTDLFAEPA